VGVPELEITRLPCGRVGGSRDDWDYLCLFLFVCLFVSLDSTTTPNIIGNVFLRSSMRYSFKKTLPSARKNPEPVPSTKDRPRELVPIEPAPEVRASVREGRGRCLRGTYRVQRCRWMGKGLLTWGKK